MRYVRQSLAIAALLALAGPARGGVIVVDVSGAGDFTDLLTAVQAAADGDTLLIKGTGPYSNFSIDGKSLVVVGDPARPSSGRSAWPISPSGSAWCCATSRRNWARPATSSRASICWTTPARSGSRAATSRAGAA
jgi:hypothetical protein